MQKVSNAFSANVYLSEVFCLPAILTVTVTRLSFQFIYAPCMSKELNLT